MVHMMETGVESEKHPKERLQQPKEFDGRKLEPTTKDGFDLGDEDEKKKLEERKANINFLILSRWVTVARGDAEHIEKFMLDNDEASKAQAGVDTKKSRGAEKYRDADDASKAKINVGNRPENDCSKLGGRVDETVQDALDRWNKNGTQGGAGTAAAQRPAAADGAGRE